MKKLLFAIMMFVLTFNMVVIAEIETTTVFITVTDITDADLGVQTIIPRQQLEVEKRNLSDYGYDGLQVLADKTTVFDALLQIHIDAYGDAAGDYMRVDSAGYIRHFMGRSVANITYKNGKDIFAFPQFVAVKNGDEINVCLYNEGYSQAVASFDKTYIYAAPGENINLNLYEHYNYPMDKNPIEGGEITDENSIYVTDTDGNISVTDVDGNVSVAFDDTGEHYITIMPKYDYYLSEDGGQTIITWEEVIKTKVVEHSAGANPSITRQDTPPENAILTDKDMAAVISYDDIFVESTDFSNVTPSGSGKYYIYKSEPWQETVEYKELIKHETFVPGEAQQMIHYTVPWIVVNVTNELIYADVYTLGNTMYARIKNSQNYPDAQIYCAGYDDTGRMVDVKTDKLTDFHRFSFAKSQADSIAYYKIMVLHGLTPVAEAYAYNPYSVAELDWDYTQPLPDNLVTVGQ